MNAEETSAIAPARQRVNQTAGELHRIVQCNEEIKAVIHTAFGIGVTALNAILLARRAGNAAVGFGVLSDELRQFARELARQMTDLRKLTESLVGTVTALVKEARFLAILARIEPTRDDIGAVVDRVRGHQEQAVSSQREALHRLRRMLAQLTGDLQPLVQLGTVLARSARIEAAYGGAFAPELTQVALEFSATILDIQQSIDALRKSAEEPAA